MGIDYSGGMYLGKWGKDIHVDDLWEFIEEHGLETASPYYDCDIDDCFVGVGLKDYKYPDHLDKMLIELEAEAKYLEPLIGNDLLLIGSQNIT